MTNKEAVNWLINITADIGKTEHRDLWHYEQALTEIKDMLESEQPEIVRCGECEYYERSDLSEYCNNPETYAIKTDSEFGCILGKRRIDE